jgi:hypothetical protein
VALMIGALGCHASAGDGVQKAMPAVVTAAIGRVVVVL